MPIVAVLLFVLSLGLAACAGTGARLDVAPMPQRDAALYPWAEKKSGVVVAVDEIVQPRRVKQYFGAALLEHGILPVNIIVSNRSDSAVTLGPGDVLLVRGRTVIDPLPLARVARVARREAGADEGEGGGDVAQYFERVALQETTLAPNESYQGVLFFPKPDAERAPERGSLFSIFGLLLEDLRMNIGVTASTGERLHFGPFRLSTTEDDWHEIFGVSRWLGERLMHE